MKEITIRTAGSEHIPLISTIEKEAASVFPPGILPEDIRMSTLPHAELKEGVQSGLLKVALSKHSLVVGFVLASRVEDTAILNKIGVRPQYMRKGIGTRLIQDAIDSLVQESCLWLTTFRESPWGAPFYSKLGFKIVEDKKRHPKSIEKRLEAEKAKGLKDMVAMRICLAEYFNYTKAK